MAKSIFKPEKGSAFDLVRLQREYEKTNKAIAHVNEEIRAALEHEEQAQRTLKEAVKAAILAVKDTPSEASPLPAPLPFVGRFGLAPSRKTALFSLRNFTCRSPKPGSFKTSWKRPRP